MTTAVVAPSSERKLSTLERSLLEVVRPKGAGWPDAVRGQQREAFEWLQRHGVTKPRDDAWRNAPLTGLVQHAVSFASGSAKAKDIATWPSAASPSSGPVLWFVNGELLTDATPVAGVRWLPLSKAVEQDPLVRAQLGSQVRLDNGFVASNTAGFSDGWCIIVEPGAVIERPIELRYLLTADAGTDCRLNLPRLLVVAGAASQVRLVERHYSRTEGTALSSEVSEIILQAGAKVEHCRWVDHGGNTWQIAASAVSVGEAAEYHGWSATTRGRFVRHDLAVRLAGRHAKAILDGLYYARKGELVAQHVRVWHEQAEGTTRECYRGVVENEGRGSFDGIIYVGQGAVKTDARQENRNLLLGPAAIAHTKPHLEIDNDDVTCSHGATVGQLDEQQLFYLRARGIAEHEARAVLTWAFAKELVDRCPNDELRTQAEQSLKAREALA